MPKQVSWAKQERRAKRKMEVALGFKVAAALGVKRENRTLFPAVAKALGQPWMGGGKAAGYGLVREYAAKHGITYKSVVRKTKVGGSKPVLPEVATDAFLNTYEWRKLRMVVLKKRGPRCECCGATPSDGKTVIHVDHIKPRRKFPELALVESNLQVLCHECNHGKGNWDETDWRVPA